ncbi:MAG: bifunctional isocitrate dehydrogenase kinase/phosphatase [Gammaproteobacteria bacterium]|nr:bifunctional isocitrate dehydrogenase kinase/phosphatase [Gammaproteobacteria bacterium]
MPRIDLIPTVARWLYEEYSLFYKEFLMILDLAKIAFEKRDFASSVRVSSRRLSLYSASIVEVGRRMNAAYPQINNDYNCWQEIEVTYCKLIKGEYAEDIARAYLHSLRRRIYHSEWLADDYSSSQMIGRDESILSEVLVSFDVGDGLSEEVIESILNIPRFVRSYANMQQDRHRVFQRIIDNLSRSRFRDNVLSQIEMINAGFYRNRGAYLVGRLIFDNDSFLPLIIALLNDESGIYVDAVLTSETYAHNIFSSTLANFHVTSSYYHEVSAILKSIMPRRPLGLHYSTIGYNHLGKVAVMSELESELVACETGLETAVGETGTVAMGFASRNSAYNLKVIRNKPTKSYKWGEFGGVESVIRKYTRVHEINRTGSMLDSIIYYKVRLDRKWFASELLEELLSEASETVSLIDDDVIFKYLIVQIKLTPLPVYLKTANEKQAETAITNLGYCIKNNAAANIFNRDLDARNYGISSYSKVYLFDYDALENLSDVKIRTNLDREDGEEDIPDWYFEDGVVFLPEELISGLCISQRHLSDMFARRHADLLKMDYWLKIQQDLLDGTVPSVSVYPDYERLDPVN